MLYLPVGGELICAELQTAGDFCVIDALQISTDSSHGQQNTYMGVCPCAAGLICSSEESDVSSVSEIFGTCKAAEPETDEENPAD
jgi:hypothetical protein